MEVDDGSKTTCPFRDSVQKFAFASLEVLINLKSEDSIFTEDSLKHLIYDLRDNSIRVDEDVSFTLSNTIANWELVESYVQTSFANFSDVINALKSAIALPHNDLDSIQRDQIIDMTLSGQFEELIRLLDYHHRSAPVTSEDTWYIKAHNSLVKALSSHPANKPHLATSDYMLELLRWKENVRDIRSHPNHRVFFKYNYYLDDALAIMSGDRSEIFEAYRLQVVGSEYRESFEVDRLKLLLGLMLYDKAPSTQISLQKQIESLNAEIEEFQHFLEGSQTMSPPSSTSRSNKSEMEMRSLTALNILNALVNHRLLDVLLALRSEDTKFTLSRLQSLITLANLLVYLKSRGDYMHNRICAEFMDIVDTPNENFPNQCSFLEEIFVEVATGLKALGFNAEIVIGFCGLCETVGHEYCQSLLCRQDWTQSSDNEVSVVIAAMKKNSFYMQAAELELLLGKHTMKRSLFYNRLHSLVLPLFTNRDDDEFLQSFQLVSSMNAKSRNVTTNVENRKSPSISRAIRFFQNMGDQRCYTKLMMEWSSFEMMVNAVMFFQGYRDENVMFRVAPQYPNSGRILGGTSSRRLFDMSRKYRESLEYLKQSKSMSSQFNNVKSMLSQSTNDGRAILATLRQESSRSSWEAVQLTLLVESLSIVLDFVDCDSSQRDSCAESLETMVSAICKAMETEALPMKVWVQFIDLILVLSRLAPSVRIFPKERASQLMAAFERTVTCPFHNEYFVALHDNSLSEIRRDLLGLYSDQITEENREFSSKLHQGRGEKFEERRKVRMESAVVDAKNPLLYLNAW